MRMSTLTSISTYSTQHCCLGTTLRDGRSRHLRLSYALAIMLLIALASSPPPRPSNSGVALAELQERHKSEFSYYRQTKIKTCFICAWVSCKNWSGSFEVSSLKKFTFHVNPIHTHAKLNLND